MTRANIVEEHARQREQHVQRPESKEIGIERRQKKPEWLEWNGGGVGQNGT